jgi:hypothetical protein
VGAQSIALAQSIAHSHIGNHIFEKNEIFEKLFLQKIKKVSIQQQILEPKNKMSDISEGVANTL